MRKTPQKSPEAPDADELAALLSLLGHAQDPARVAFLARYLGVLVRWNARMNLVGRTDWRAIVSELLVDSFHLARVLSRVPGLLPLAPHDLALDLGSGAGLPGIPLRVLVEGGRFVLVEARAKRAAFLRQAAAETGLPGLEVAEGLAERVVPPLLGPGPARLVVSQAFMPPPKLAGFVRPWLGEASALAVMFTAANREDLPGYETAAREDYSVMGSSKSISVFLPKKAPS